jgi:hypothetical protein
VTFAGDPFLPYVAWNAEGSPYGPLWELLAAVPSWLAGDNLWNNLIFFKCLVIFFFGISTLLTYLILRVLKPEWSLRGTLFFAWNPLVLFEVAGNGHNDVVMVTFVLLAILLFVRGHGLWVLPALMAGVLTKFIVLLLIPIAVASLWRDRLPFRDSRLLSLLKRRLLRRPHQGSTSEARVSNATEEVHPLNRPSNRTALTTIVLGSLLALILSVSLYAPFWQGPNTIGALGRQNLYTASLPSLSYQLLEANFKISTEDAKNVTRNAALALTALTVLGLALFIFVKGNANTAPSRRSLVFRTLGAFYEVLFVYLAFATLWFQPWYLIWLVALTPVVALYTNANRTFLFCVGGIATYFVYIFLWFWNKSGSLDITLTAAFAIYFTPLFYAVYTLLKSLYERVWNRESLPVYVPKETEVGHVPTRAVRPKS